MLDIKATITGIRYKYSMCRKLNEYSAGQIQSGMPNDATFYLNIDGEKVALSYWVSPKRTRSYPYARVYDSLNFSGKKITVIPVMKDEGVNGDRDYIQWDTVSLMSLLGVYVIIGYYKDASVSRRFENKITDQVFDMEYVLDGILDILSYQSDALHWNLTQIDRLQEVGNKAINSYQRIFQNFGQGMHSIDRARLRINQVMNEKERFMNFSRDRAKEAQNRESQIIQQGESIVPGEKSTITIKNYLGGEYYLTADEAKIGRDCIYLIEAKNSGRGGLPATSDIKDGLIKMVLFSNLTKVTVNNVEYQKKAVLKLTGNESTLTPNEISTINLLKREASDNGFHILLNDEYIA